MLVAQVWEKNTSCAALTFINIDASRDFARWKQMPHCPCWPPYFSTAKDGVKHKHVCIADGQGHVAIAEDIDVMYCFWECGDFKGELHQDLRSF